MPGTLSADPFLQNVIYATIIVTLIVIVWFAGRGRIRRLRKMRESHQKLKAARSARAAAGGKGRPAGKVTRGKAPQPKQRPPKQPG